MELLLAGGDSCCGLISRNLLDTMGAFESCSVFFGD